METLLTEILIALWAIGFTWFAFMFNRLEKRLDAFTTETRAEFKELRAEFKELRGDLAEEFRAQRAEAAAQIAAIASAITASRRSEP